MAAADYNNPSLPTRKMGLSSKSRPRRRRLSDWPFGLAFYNLLALYFLVFSKFFSENCVHSFLAYIMGFVAAANYFLSARPPYLSLKSILRMTMIF